jgi:hypothetical protein
MARVLVAKLTPFTGRSTQNGNLSGFAFALVRGKSKGPVRARIEKAGFAC